MNSVIIYKQLNPHYCRTYLIHNNNTHQIAIIDPVLDHLKDYMNMMDSEQLTLKYVIDTHTHADHISCCAALKDLTNCQYLMHENAPPGCVTQRLRNNSEIDILGIKVKILYTPGHTQDSICLILPDRIFTGDTLFLDDGGAGRDDLPGGSAGLHWESLQKIIRLPDDLVVYPAHEYRNRQPSDLAKQMRTNPHLKERTKEEFITYLEDLKLGPAEWMKDVLKANYACARNPKAAWIPTDLPACEVKGTMDVGVNEIEVKPISADELKIKLDEEKLILLLDVREQNELVSELGHIEGINHIPIASLTSRVDELNKYKDKEIVTICRSGARAHTAAQIMKQVGFSNIAVLDGGMINWNALGYPVSRKWPI